MRAHEARQHLNHALGADRARHVDGQAFSGALVDDGRASLAPAPAPIPE